MIQALDTYKALLLNEDPPRTEEVTEIQDRDAGELLCYAAPDKAEKIVEALNNAKKQEWKGRAFNEDQIKSLRKTVTDALTSNVRNDPKYWVKETVAKWGISEMVEFLDLENRTSEDRETIIKKLGFNPTGPRKKRKITIEVEGETDGDVEEAEAEAQRKIQEGYFSGSDSNDRGSYSFEVKED